MAPPTVTNRVPGVTGRNQPRGTHVRSTTSSDVPADGRDGAPLRIELDLRRRIGQLDRRAAGVLRRVAVAAAEPPGDGAAAGRPREQATQTLDVAGSDAGERGAHSASPGPTR